MPGAAACIVSYPVSGPAASCEERHCSAASRSSSSCRCLHSVQVAAGAQAEAALMQAGGRARAAGTAPRAARPASGAARGEGQVGLSLGLLQLMLLHSAYFPSPARLRRRCGQLHPCASLHACLHCTHHAPPHPASFHHYAPPPPPADWEDEEEWGPAKQRRSAAKPRGQEQAAAAPGGEGDSKAKPKQINTETPRARALAPTVLHYVGLHTVQAGAWQALLQPWCTVLPCAALPCLACAVKMYCACAAARCRCSQWLHAHHSSGAVPQCLQCPAHPLCLPPPHLCAHRQAAHL